MESLRWWPGRRLRGVRSQGAVGGARRRRGAASGWLPEDASMHPCAVPVGCMHVSRAGFHRKTLGPRYPMLIWHVCTHVRKVACIVLFTPSTTRWCAWRRATCGVNVCTSCISPSTHCVMSKLETRAVWAMAKRGKLRHSIHFRFVSELRLKAAAGASAAASKIRPCADARPPDARRLAARHAVAAGRAAARWMCRAP